MGGIAQQFAGRASEIAVQGTGLDKEIEYRQQKAAQDAEAARLEQEAKDRVKKEEEARLKAEADAKAAATAQKGETRRRVRQGLFSGSAFDPYSPNSLGRSPGKKTLLGA